MKSHALLLAFLAFALSAYSQNVTFQRLFGNSLDNRFNKVIRHADDFYVLGTDEVVDSVTAHATLSKLNFQGQLQWTVRLGVPSIWNDIIVTDEGNLLLVGATMPYDVNAFSLMGVATPNGDFLWVNMYNFADRELLSRAVRHPNPPDPAFPYYVLGITQQPNFASSDDINLINIDASGNVNWRWLIGDNGDEEFYRDIEILSNGNLLLSGHANTSAVTVIVNPSGEVVSGNQYSSGTRIYDAVERPGAGFYFAGSSMPASPAQLTRVNPNFQVVWSRTIPQLTFVSRVWIGGPDQALYVLGFGNVNGAGRYVVIKITETANVPAIQWVKHLDGGETAYASGNLFFLPPGQIAYVDGRSDHPIGFGQSDAFLSVSDIDFETCITQLGPTLSLTSFAMASTAYSTVSAPAPVPTPADMPKQGVAWQQIAICGSSCEPVNSPTFSAVLAPQTPTVEIALDAFQASNGEHVSLGLSTGFSQFSLDLIFVRMDNQGALIGEPRQLDFFSNSDELEMLVDSETQSNAHLTEVFDNFGASQGYLLAATMFNSVFSPSGPPTPDILVALLDHEGCVVWSRFLERPNFDEYARGALQLPNGDLLVLVERISAGAGVMQLLRFPINGQDCTEFTYDLPAGDSFLPASLAKVQDLNNPDAAIAIAGSYRKAGLRYVGVSILRSDLSIVGPGPLLFDMLPANTDDIPTPNGIVQKGQNLAVARVLRKNSLDREGFLMELSPFSPNGDVDGAVMWARRIRLSASNGQFPNGYRIYALDVNQAGELFAGGAAFLSSESSHAFLLKTNSQGMVQKINMFTGEFEGQQADNARVFDLRVAPDGSAVLAGYRPRPSLSDGYFWIARTDPNGNLHNCDCFDPLSLQIENYQPVFSQSTSAAPAQGACNSGFTIPACNPFQREVAYCDQFSPLPPCLAGFTWQTDNDCGEVQFTNQSIGAIPEYLWQFGDPFNSASTETNPSFAYLSSGTYTVCLTVTTADCSDTYCEQVTVTLAGAPATLSCPPNASIEADPGACENTSYQLPEANVTDNCPCDPILDVDYPPGYFGPYPAGTSTFTVAAVDACGFVTCQVSVTVDDGQAPSIVSCPADITLPLGASTDPSVAGEPLVDDPCGDATITFSDFLIDSGPCFSITERTWIAADPNGNADTCKHIITLLDLTPPIISCPDVITVESCQAAFDDFDIEVETNCSGPEDWQFNYALTGATTGAGAGLPTGIPFQPGTTQVAITVQTLPGVSANCSFEVVVIDITAGFTAAPLSDCEDAWQFTPAVQDDSYTYLWNFGDGNSSSEIAPQHFYSQSGNFLASLLLTTSGGCEAFTQALVAVQLQLEGSVSSATNCKTVELAGAPTGPGLTWTWETPAGTFIGDSVSVEFPEYGVFEVCATLTDGICTQVVCTAIVLEDLQAPVMSCADVELTAGPGLCTAPFTPTVPDATDNCGSVTVGGIRADGLPLDAPWPGGETCITWTATDEAGNTSICLQCITVIDEELPTIACPEDLVVEADLGASTAVVVFDSPTASDNCGLDSVFCSPASGVELPIGVYAGTCTAIDDFGNDNECVFIITVLPSSDTCCVDSMAFLANVNAGFSWSLIGGCEYEFAPNQLNGCQQVIEWTWGDGTTAPGPGAVTHFFPSDGDYTVCMLVAEFDEATGEICWTETYCETLSIACADICELNLLPLRTGYNYADQELLPAGGAWDPYWSPGMITVPSVGGLPPLPGSNWIVPEEGPGYYLRRVEFNFCLPAGSFDCEDLLFELDMQAWAVAAIRINGLPADGTNLFQNPAYGATGSWTFQPGSANCGLFREGGDTLTLDVKTVYPAGGLNISGSLSTLSGQASLGAPGCCAPPPCDCAAFTFDKIGIIPSFMAEANPCLRAFRPEGVDDCDEVEWYLNAELIASGTGADWVYMELPNGAGEVCLRVTRTNPQGNFCGVIEKCWDFIVDCSAPETCANSVVENPGFEGTQGVLGQDGNAAPWTAAFGNPWVAGGPGATDANHMILSGNNAQGDAFYQEIAVTPGQVYQLSLSALRYLPARPGENTRLVVRIADQPQTSFTCTGNCQTLANITELSDAEWYRHIFSWQAFSTSLKYLHVFVRNDFSGAGPAARSYVQVDNVCLDIVSSVGEQPFGQALRIFPNPTGGELTIQPMRPFSEEARLTVFDLWGRPALSQELQAGAASYPLSLAALPPAVYWLEVSDGLGNIWRERVVKL